jgi:hypothetical protein
MTMDGSPVVAAGRARNRALPAGTSPLAGDVLLHPLVIASIVTLIVNDHVLKRAAPGLLTGKLSDVAGLVFFPLLAVAGCELVTSALGRWEGPSARALMVSTLVSAVVFAAAKTTELGAAAVAWGLGGVQWLTGSVSSVLGGTAVGSVRPVQIVRDPTDLVALLALAAAVAIGVGRTRRAGYTSGGRGRGQ